MRKLFVCFIVLLLLAGCKFKMDGPDYERIARVAGYNAAYWTLKNNPGYISKVEKSLAIARGAISSGKVDPTDLANEIIDFAMEFIEQPEFKEIAGPVKEALRSFKGIIEIQFEKTQDQEEILKLIVAFLDGAETGTTDAGNIQVKIWGGRYARMG